MLEADAGPDVTAGIQLPNNDWLPPAGDLANLGNEPVSLVCLAPAGRFFIIAPPGKPRLIKIDEELEAS